jgi:thiosulfate/3-mercaptopyruvate sulfurtransferase
MAGLSRWFVSTDWLASHLDDPEVVVLDGTWHLANTGRNARKEYDAGHIPGAIFFDIDAVADIANPLPHMLPSPEAFAEAVGALGIDNRQKIVVYDGLGLSSAPRVWWTFHIMGAGDVVILEGGLPKWIAEGRPVSSDVPVRNPRTFMPSFRPTLVYDLDKVRSEVASGAVQLVDARPAARFRGEAPEPRSWVKSGHVPGSFSVPSMDLIADGRLKDAKQLRVAFASSGVDLDRPIVTSCGSGVNAATLNLALQILGVEDAALYDGSWTEWGARDDLAIAHGKSP